MPVETHKRLYYTEEHDNLPMPLGPVKNKSIFVRCLAFLYL